VISLNLLHIENIAVIEKADIEFGPGLNVLTGETGAGKSIVIDAIGALLGGRVSRDLVRSGANGALITAEFTVDEMIKKWLLDNDLGDLEDGELLLLRKISSEGKSSCRVNGVPLSVSQLRELGELLIDIHGQNDGRKLLSETNHRIYLDNYAGLGEQVRDYADTYRKYIASKNELTKLNQLSQNKNRIIEELKSKIEEISSAGAKPLEQEALLERRAIVKNAGKLTESVRNAYRALYGDEENDGALSLIISAASSLSSVSGVIGSIQALSDGINDIRYRVEDITEQIDRLYESLDFSPNELEAIESRLALLQKLERRYGSIDEMLLILENAKSELENMELLTDSISALEERTKKLYDEALKSAQCLSDNRKVKAAELERRITSELSQLNMPGVRFKVEVSAKAGKSEFDETGCDEIRFLMSANAGEPVGRISKIASGGELSRIMLAMKSVLSSADEVGIQIFDEIDTGVSGVAAQKVGEKLNDLALLKQTLCVTHLPQIAVMADRHFSIEKKQNNNRTYTNVSVLDNEGRKCELARMVGGENITEGTLLSAGELLNAALRYKERKKSNDSL
jgi:DNA repair protein RecN (Recombination protein N)